MIWESQIRFRQSQIALAIIFDRKTEKWFKPAKDQFQLYDRRGTDDIPYQADFVAESKSGLYMLEPKSTAELEAPEVRAKKDVATKWLQPRIVAFAYSLRKAVDLCGHPPQRHSREYDFGRPDKNIFKLN